MICGILLLVIKKNIVFRRMIMNQKDWVEYFEAVNGRKPSMQEFQEAREKGEFVVNKPDTPASAPVAPRPQVQPTSLVLFLLKWI